jgi:hypothetical protein
MTLTLSPHAQTLYDAINKKTIQNSYYDDERYNPVKTPDLNKAYSCIQTLLENPETLAHVLQEKTHPPSLPEIQTPMATYLKIALAGDFDQQLSKESDHQKNFDTLARLAQVSQQHPQLLGEELWEKETPLFLLENGGIQKIETLTGDDPLESLPPHLHHKLREEAWSVYYIASKPLLTIACRRLFASAQDWRWSDPPTPQDIDRLKNLAQNLNRLPTFAQRLEETLGADSQPPNLDTYQKILQEYAKRTLSTKPQGVSQLLAEKELPHNIRTHLLVHYLTGKTASPLLQTLLQKEKNKLLELKQNVQKQNHLPV